MGPMTRGSAALIALIARQDQAFLAAAVPAHLPHTRCAGTGLISQDVWTLAREVDRAIQVTHVPREFAASLSAAFFAVMRSEALEEAIEDCALGMAVLAIHALPEAELRFGMAAAHHYYMLYAQLVRDYGHLRNSAGFSWSLESHQSASYPMLLGLQPQTCSGLDLKIYVYDTPFAQHALGCSQGMFASEVFVHRFLMHSDCRTQDPQDADFFFVPVYAACVMTKNGKSAAEMDAFYKDLLGRLLQHFDPHGGRDHIFLWSSETYDFPSWLQHLHSAVFLSVEANPIECSDFDFFSEETAENFGTSCRHCQWCFSPWKDVVIPGFVESWSIRKMRTLERAPAERTFTACYHGADSDHLAIYKHANASVRNELQRLRDLPNVSIGYRFAKVTDYFDRLGQCHFCFVPKGLGYWSNRLYEVLFAGCIPVLLSDSISLPFDDFLDWKTFSLKWPMAKAAPALVSHLADLLYNHRPLVDELHASVKQNRCWFDYNSEDPHCSPYLGIFRLLEKRKAALAHGAGRTWWR